MIEECYVNEESAIDVSGEAREVSSQVGRNVLSLPDQTRLGKVNYKLAPTSPSPHLQHSFQRCSAAVFYAPDTILSLPPLPSALIYVFARGKLSYLIIAPPP